MGQHDIDPDNLPYALETLTRTTLRNIVGEMELDQTLGSRDIINKRMREVIEEASIGWGVDVTRVEQKHLHAVYRSEDRTFEIEIDERKLVVEHETGLFFSADGEALDFRRAFLGADLPVVHGLADVRHRSAEVLGERRLALALLERLRVGLAGCLCRCRGRR